MLIRIIVLLVTVPLLETTLLLWLADVLGFPITFGMVVVSGLLGAWLLRRQGLRVVRRIRAEMAAGRMPARELLDGMFILVGGVLLLTPGVLTDALGMALLLPVSRGWVRGWAARWIQSHWHFQVVSRGAAADTEYPRSQVVDSYVVRSGEQRDL